MVPQDIPDVSPVAKFKVGDIVQTKRGNALHIKGIVQEVIIPNKELLMLWGSLEPHYLVKDTKNDEYLSVIERGLERA